MSPDVLIAVGETADSGVRLRSHLKLQDPLIQQMALALKTELEIAGEDSKLYADSMTIALAAHLLRRYAVKNFIKEYRGGLPPYQLKILC